MAGTGIEHYIFWYKRPHRHNREMFFRGLLEIAEYLNDKTYGDGRVYYTKQEPDKLVYYVPIGEQMRIKVLCPAMQDIANKFRMEKISVWGGRHFVADLETFIKVHLPQNVQDMTGLHGNDRRVWSLEQFIRLHGDFVSYVDMHSAVGTLDYGLETFADTF